MNKFCSFRPSFWLLSVLVSGCMLAGATRLSARLGCVLACDAEITVEIPISGSLGFFPADMLEGDTRLQCPGGLYRTTVEINRYRLPATGNFIFDTSHIGQTFMGAATDTNSGNTCWGEVHVQAEAPFIDTLHIELCAVLWKDAKPVNGSTLVLQPYNPSFPYAPIVFDLDTNQHCATLTLVQSDYLPGTTFSFSAEGPDLEAKNGLDLADLCLLAKYILGVEPFSSPYAVYAGDANNSGSVTTFDIVTIQRIMMGREDNFPNSSIWKTFPEGCVFSNPGSPLPVPEPCISLLTMAELQALDGDTIRTIMAKTGDVNGDVLLPGVQNNDPILSDPFLLTLPQGPLDAGSSFSMPVKAGRDLDFGGIQATIAVNTNLVQFVEVESGVINMNNGGTHYWDANLSQLQIVIGPISTSYSVQEGEVLFYIRVFATQMSELEDIVSLNVLGINPKALGSDCSTTSPIGVEYAALVATQAPSLAGARIQAPSPNPFAEQTVLELDLLQGETAQLEVLDLQGRVLFSETKDLPMGNSRWEIPASVMPAGSMAIWQLKMKGQMTAGKLVRQ